MKKIIFFSLVTMLFHGLYAQTIDQGDKYLYYERAKSAEAVYHHLLKQDANNAEAWYKLVKAYAQEDAVNKAGDTILFAPQQVRSEPYYKAAAGYVALQQNRKQEAAELFNTALNDTKEKDENILAAVATAHIDSKEGDANYAIELLQKAIKRDKKNPALYVMLGDAYRKLNNGNESFLAYQEALDKDANYALAYHRIGKIFLSQNNSAVYLDYFNKAVAADPLFSPSLYMLYAYEFTRDPLKAKEYYNKYMQNSDLSFQNNYDLADLHYVSKEYDQAIEKANAIINAGIENVKPRIYKLMGYSYAALKDTSKAINSMEAYFKNEADSNLVAKDFLSMAELYTAMPGQDSLAIVYLEKGSALEKDSTKLLAYYKKLADVAKTAKDYKAQAKWLAKYYPGNDRATNLDLFNWGLAHYLSGDYANADSVFGKYSAKYPEQSFGYYWQAKAKALSDSGMLNGLAVSTYKKLVEVLKTDTANVNNKKWMIESYEYLAAYEANVEKDYIASVDYFKKVLELDPGNKDAEKYIRILEKSIANKNSSE